MGFILMSGISQKFTEEQVRALIFSLNLIGEKNSGYIPVNSLNDASEIIAYISGFDSWKQLRNSLRKDSVATDNYNYIAHPKSINNFKLLEQAKKATQTVIEVNIESFNILENKLKLPKLKFLHDTNYDVTKIEQMATGHLIVGSMFDPNLKYEKLYHLNPQNTLCISNSPNFFDNICQQAYKRQKHLIDFSHVHHNMSESNNHPFVKLDPLNEVYCSDHFDLLFQLDFDNSHGFDLLWSLLIKNHCQSNNYMINTNILKDFLSLDFLTLYAVSLKKNKNPLSSLLEKYLLSLKIKKEENKIIYQQDYVIEHLNNIKNIYLNVIHMEELYNNGTFSYQSHQLIFDFIKRKSICVNTPFIITDYGSHIYSLTLDYCTQQFDNICESQNYKHSNYNSLIINSNPKLFKLESLYNKNYTYHLRINNHFENNLIKLFQQIIFGKINFIETPNKDWLIKFFLFTPDTINIFAMGNQLLRESNEENAFLWKTNDKHPVLAQDSFIIDEIKIYEPEQRIK